MTTTYTPSEGLEALADEDLAMFRGMTETALLDPATAPGTRRKLEETLVYLKAEQEFRAELAEQDLVDDLTAIDDVTY
jgi:hypothetical protein